jgi:hypothetical protein
MICVVSDAPAPDKGIRGNWDFSGTPSDRVLARATEAVHAEDIHDPH